MDARKIIGWNIRVLRVEKGLSQERLGLEAGIDRSYVGRVERGSENVTVDALEKFAAALGATVARLLVDPPAGSSALPRLPSGRKRNRPTAGPVAASDRRASKRRS